MYHYVASSFIVGHGVLQFRGGPQLQRNSDDGDKGRKRREQSSSPGVVSTQEAAQLS
jgi:hypothetical protein